jgi:hypothetical protein
MKQANPMEFVVVPTLVLYMDLNSSYAAGLRAPYDVNAFKGTENLKLSRPGQYLQFT